MKRDMKVLVYLVATALVLIALPYVTAFAATTTPGAGGLVPCAGPDCTFDHLIQAMQGVMGFLLAIAVPIFAVLFSWAGFLMVTAGGNAATRQKAKGIMTTAFIGFGIALGAFLIVNLLATAFLENIDARDPFKGGLNVPQQWIARAENAVS